MSFGYLFTDHISKNAAAMSPIPQAFLQCGLVTRGIVCFYHLHSGLALISFTAVMHWELCSGTSSRGVTKDPQFLLFLEVLSHPVHNLAVGKATWRGHLWREGSWNCREKFCCFLFQLSPSLANTGRNVSTWHDHCQDQQWQHTAQPGFQNHEQMSGFCFKLWSFGTFC